MPVVLPRLQSWPHRLGRRLGALMTYDVCPSFSARVRRRLYNPLGVLTLAAGTALLCGFFLHRQGFILFAGILTVILLGILWPWLSLRGLRGGLSFERARVSEGEEVAVCLTLRNRFPWSAWGLAVRDGFSDGPAQSEGTAPVVRIAAAPGWRTVRCQWSFAPARRGIYPLGVPCLTTGFPFGLWENRRRLVVENTLLVWPRTYPVGPVPQACGNPQGEGHVARNQVDSNGDVLGVRPYRRGDALRRIHWAQSARHDRLIVCELHANVRPVLQLVLDTDPRVHAGAGPTSSREWAIRIVASLAKGWLEAGAQVGAVWNSHHLPAAAGPGQLRRLLESLANLPDSSGLSLAATLARPGCRLFTHGLQVVVTTAASVAMLGQSGRADDRQRWIVLQEQAFSVPPVEPAPPRRLPVRPWLWIDDPAAIPALLRGGWKEARHGS